MTRRMRAAIQMRVRSGGKPQMGDENVSYLTFSSRCTPLPEVHSPNRGANLPLPPLTIMPCKGAAFSTLLGTPLQSPRGCRGAVQELLAIWQLRDSLQDTEEGFHVH